MKKYLLSLIPVFCFCLAGFAQIPFSESFNNDTINSKWIFINHNDSSYARLTGTGEYLMFASALNGGSDFCNCSNYNAPYLLQRVDTALHNYLIETRIHFNPTLNWQGAGIIFQTSPDSSLSTSIQRTAYRYYIIDQGSAVSAGEHFSYDDTTVYLRVLEGVDSSSAWYSHDGQNWNNLGAFTNAPVYYIGIASERQAWSNSTDVNTSAYFDYFTVTLINTGSNPVLSDPVFSIRPNPVKNTLTLSAFTGLETQTTFTISNILGQTQMRLKMNNGETSFDVSALLPGVYFLSIENIAGNTVKKFIKD